MTSVDSLRNLPSVSEILALPDIVAMEAEHGHDATVAAIREAIAELRNSMDAHGCNSDRPAIAAAVQCSVRQRLEAQNLQRLTRVINATGVILHTSLGRAPLAEAAVRAVTESAGHCNLEVDLQSGDRRQRGYQVAEAWRQLTGAEASLVVNNNAAATLLTLQALCTGSEVIISRGQLIEIGGSFRLPDIFALSGSILREVGTTNRTRLSDYASAIGPQTAAILRVHPSNYRVVGFAETPSIQELAELGHAHGLTVIDDIGSGCLLDLTRYGLPSEPTFGESLRAGADVVLGSGDKLLGGPQCGIILGREAAVWQIQKHPLARAVRIDKMTLAALSATLDLYSRGVADEQLPVLQMLSASVELLTERARALVAAIQSTELPCEVRAGTSEIGGGSLPTVQLPTAVVAVRHSTHSAQQLAEQLRTGQPRVFGRIQEDTVLLDLRSVMPADESDLVLALRRLTLQSRAI